MSKIEQLIKELCPNGVEYKRLDSCCNILDNKRKPVTKSERQSGKYPYYGANGVQDYVSDYIFDGNFVLVGEDGSVITSNGTPVVIWAEGKIWVNNHAHIIEEIDDVLLRYLFHYIQTINISKLIHGNIPKLTGKDFKSLQIPVPTLQVQHEIVRILDTFSEYTTELTEELTMRKKQYEYYRDSLLSFGDEVEWKTLGEVCDLQNGFAFKSSLFKDKGLPIVRITNINGINVDLTDVKYFDHIDYNSNSLNYSIVKGDVLIAMSGATTGKIGYYNLNETAYLNQRVGKFIPNKMLLNNRYLYHFLLTKTDFMNVLAGGGSQPNLSSNILKEKLEVPLPPLEVQEEIVRILDTFSELTAELTAELEYRRKQYEYYRDSLLTFGDDEVEWKKIKDVFQRIKGTSITASKMKEIATDTGEKEFLLEEKQ